MARPKVEINPICGKRLKQICKEQGITQLQLSKLIHLSQQGVSAIVNGHASLTGEMANRVIEKFPQYRVEWLLGHDDIPTEEYGQSYKRAMLYRDQLMNEAYANTVASILIEIIKAESAYNKKDIKISVPWRPYQMHDDGLIPDDEWDAYTQGKGLSENTKAQLDEHADYILTIDGESISIPVRYFFLLADDVEQYGLFRLREYIKNKKRRYY